MHILGTHIGYWQWRILTPEKLFTLKRIAQGTRQVHCIATAYSPGRVCLESILKED